MNHTERFFAKLLLLLLLTGCQQPTQLQPSTETGNLENLDWPSLIDANEPLGYPDSMPLLNPAHRRLASGLLRYKAASEDYDFIAAKIALLERQYKKAYRHFSPYLSDLDWECDWQRHLAFRTLSHQERWQKAIAYGDPSEISYIINKKSIAELRKALKQSQDAEIIGWLEWGLLAKTPQHDIQTLKSQWQSWQERFSTHPAQQRSHWVPNSDFSESPVGIILPFSGDLAHYANAIREGVMAACLHSKNACPWRLHFFDSHQKTLADIHAEGRSLGIRRWIGPLEKDEVDAFTDMLQNDEMAIVLNRSKPHRSSWSMSLTPEDEAEQLADKVFNLGYRHALIITGRHAWAQRLADTFRQKFESKGGRIVEEVNLSQNNDAKHLRDALHISASQRRYHNLIKKDLENIKFIPTPRQDMEMIFLAMESDDALQVRPLLKFNLMGDVPTLATSAIVDDQHNNHRDKDLDGIVFADSAWWLQHHQQDVLGSNILNLMHDLKRDHSRSFNGLHRFYGLGVDALHALIYHEHMRLFPDIGIAGANGQLYIQDQHLLRKLDLLRYRNGKIQLTEDVME